MSYFLPISEFKKKKILTGSAQGLYLVYCVLLFKTAHQKTQYFIPVLLKMYENLLM